MATATTHEGMRNALGALRIGRGPGIAAADFCLTDAYHDHPRELFGGRPDWRDWGVLPGDKVEWEFDMRKAELSVRVVLREEAPSFVDLMAA